MSTLHESLSYNLESGNIYWILGKRKGYEAGSLDSRGYLVVYFQKKRYPAHRLAWELYYGVAPTMIIDHISGNKLDNRIHNLREVSNKENLHNRGLNKNNKTGYRGVSYIKSRNKYQAMIMINGKNVRLGFFKDAETASEVYKSAERQHRTHYRI